MNREIKFRGFDTSNNSGMYNHIPVEQMIKDGITVMQYTGLKDIEEKELYIGDIVNVHYFYFNGNEAEAEMTGILGEREFGLTLENVKGRQFQEHTGYSEDEGWLYLSTWGGLHEESFTLLGNIHQNPDLL
jgi:uncharacterized phage protein (TIGR01671 family)